MLVNQQPQRTIRYCPERACVEIIDQTLLPHRFQRVTLHTLEDACHAISSMQVRGAPLIGATAAFGLALALRQDPSPEHEARAAQRLIATRPTAVNLAWAVQRVRAHIAVSALAQRSEHALAEAQRICEDDVAACERIGEHGLQLLAAMADEKKRRLNILTHCNAGWLATVDWGTALAPIYKAQQAGIDIHVWVDETRPRNQGASLTAWELAQQGIAHTVIADNTGGHLMQHGQVDLCLVGSDRTTASGDVCNKIGTYLKALAASDNGLPFYVALPASTIDWQIEDGLRDIPIEQRDAREVTHISGLNGDNQLCEVRLVDQSPAVNYGFDVTPARLISGLITEYGCFQASSASLQSLRQLIE